MVSPNVLAVVTLAICHSVSAAALSQQPTILLNLTLDEFMQRRQDGRGASIISKRELVGQETENRDATVRELIEARSADCAKSFGAGMRVTRSHCGTTLNVGGPRARMDLYCQRPPTDPYDGYRHTTRACKKGQECVALRMINYAGQIGKVTYCKDKFPVNKRPGPEVELPPVYDGWKTLPDEQWSPGSFDYFFQVADSMAGLTASWELRGHHANGWGFIDDPKGKATSYSCLGCPSGTLYAETVGFKTQVEGFTLPSVL